MAERIDAATLDLQEKLVEIKLRRKCGGHSLIAIFQVEDLHRIGLYMDGQFHKFLHFLAGPIYGNAEIIEQDRRFAGGEGIVEEDKETPKPPLKSQFPT